MLLDLPDDVLEAVLDRCTVGDLLRLQAVCKGLAWSRRRHGPRLQMFHGCRRLHGPFWPPFW